MRRPLVFALVLALCATGAWADMYDDCVQAGVATACRKVLRIFFDFFGLRIDLTYMCGRKVRGSVSERPLHAVRGVESEGVRGISHTSPVSTRVRVTTAAGFASKASSDISTVCLR